VSAPERLVLLTGATGAIGSAVIGDLLRNSQDRVCVLLRASSLSEAESRLMALLAFLQLDLADPTVRRRIELVPGDVTRPHYGIDPQQYQRLTREVTHIINASGNVKLNQPLEAARRDAVTPVQHLLALVRECVTNGALSSVQYLSTVGVCGSRPGLIPEATIPGERRFRNTYEAAKAEAEDLMLEAAAAGLPITIHRPSMVVGDSHTGRIIHFQVFYFLMELLLGNMTRGVIPKTGPLKLDIIPSDYVARALILAARSPEACGRIFHLCSGPQRSVRLDELSQRLRLIFSSNGIAVPRPRAIDPRRVTRILAALSPVLPKSVRRATRTLPFLVSYMDDDQMFDNTQTEAFFATQGLVAPPVGTYLNQIVEYYIAERCRVRPLPHSFGAASEKSGWRTRDQS